MADQTHIAGVKRTYTNAIGETFVFADGVERLPNGVIRSTKRLKAGERGYTVIPPPHKHAKNASERYTHQLDSTVKRAKHLQQVLEGLLDCRTRYLAHLRAGRMPYANFELDMGNDELVEHFYRYEDYKRYSDDLTEAITELDWLRELVSVFDKDQIRPRENDKKREIPIIHIMKKLKRLKYRLEDIFESSESLSEAFARQETAIQYASNGTTPRITLKTSQPPTPEMQWSKDQKIFLLDLPSLVLDNILKFVDNIDLLYRRAVCRKTKFAVDDAASRRETVVNEIKFFEDENGYFTILVQIPVEMPRIFALGLFKFDPIKPIENDDTVTVGENNLCPF